MPLTVSFFCGRLVSYALYVGGASVAQDSLERVLADGLVSPAAIALQIAMLALLAAFVLIPWARLLGIEAPPSGASPESATDVTPATEVPPEL